MMMFHHKMIFIFNQNNEDVMTFYLFYQTGLSLRADEFFYRGRLVINKVLSPQNFRNSV